MGKATEFEQFVGHQVHFAYCEFLAPEMRGKSRLIKAVQMGVGRGQLIAVDAKMIYDRLAIGHAHQ